MIKKIVNGILVSFLLLITAGVLKKCSNKSSNALEAPIANVNIKPYENFSVSKDTFKLELLNRNPFKTGRSYITPVKIVKKSNSSAFNSVAVKKFKWPIIEYYGFVKGNNSKDRLALIKINNRLYRKRENQTLGDLKIKKAYSDSIIVIVNNSSKTIARK
ncbi:hypothetical protein [Olleya sp. HaHaR_3_96]|uniref:hypothetical protein n=1 Tax=Olleya sp. HaHaR_3_96 TaxID=2745560 RepID=UPI001C50074F|nr:hypothetical protein [Olleya sp. HaHaR_3_96]QXP58407.1 hypothetical protein H0I26_10795 [Olleya sp. HaHaR_3_96]